MKLWVDDIRPAPDNTYIVCRSVNEAKRLIEDAEVQSSIPRMFDCNFRFSVIDIDHDAGDYACDGGDYIKLLDWLEETGRNYPIHIHSMNPVGVQNMRRIIERNGWKEV